MAEAMPQIHYIAQAKVAVETARHLLTLPWPCAPRCKGPEGLAFSIPGLASSLLSRWLSNISHVPGAFQFKNHFTVIVFM